MAIGLMAIRRGGSGSRRWIPRFLGGECRRRDWRREEAWRCVMIALVRTLLKRTYILVEDRPKMGFEKGFKVR